MLACQDDALTNKATGPGPKKGTFRSWSPPSLSIVSPVETLPTHHPSSSFPPYSLSGLLSLQPHCTVTLPQLMISHRILCLTPFSCPTPFSQLIALWTHLLSLSCLFPFTYSISSALNNLPILTMCGILPLQCDSYFQSRLMFLESLTQSSLMCINCSPVQGPTAHSLYVYRKGI